MPYQNFAEFDEDYDGNYRNEGAKQNQPPQPKKSYDPVKPPYQPESESPELNMDDDDSSPVVQYAPQMPQTMSKVKSEPKTHTYMQYEYEEEKIEVDKTLFAAHPMHKCPTLCEYIKDCMLHLERTMHMLMCRPDAYQRARQIAIMQDCVEVCHLTTRQVARRSPMLRMALRYCAKVCRTCGQESMRYPDPESQASARMCLHCADICEKFVRHHNWQ